MQPTGNSPDALGPVAERIWGRYGSSPGLISLEMLARLARRLTSPGRAGYLPLLNDVYQRWTPGEVSRSYPGPGVPLVWLSPLSGTASGAAGVSWPSAETRAPHRRNAPAELPSVTVTPNANSAYEGRKFDSPVFRSAISTRFRLRSTPGSGQAQDGPAADSVRGALVEPRTFYGSGGQDWSSPGLTMLERHQRLFPLGRTLQRKAMATATMFPMSRHLTATPQPALPRPFMARSISMPLLSTKEPQPLGEALTAEAQEGGRNSRRPGTLERHWSFPAVARAIERAEVSSTWLKLEVPQTSIVVSGDVSSISRAPGPASTSQSLFRASETTRSPSVVREAHPEQGRRAHHERASGRSSIGDLGLSAAQRFGTSTPAEPHQSGNDQITNRNQPIQASTQGVSKEPDSPPWEGDVRGGDATSPSLPFVRGGTFHPFSESASTLHGNPPPEIWPIGLSVTRTSDLGSSILERQGRFSPLGRAVQLMPQATGGNAGVASFDLGFVRSGNPQLPDIDQTPSNSHEIILRHEANLSLPRAFPPGAKVLNRTSSPGDRPSLTQPDLPLIQMPGAGTRRTATNNQAPEPSAGSARAMLMQRASARPTTVMPERDPAATPMGQPANGAPPGPPPASNPEGVDLDRLADRVYTIIERRLTQELESLGL
jgi:hypothetical protein